jgi:acetyl esterase/lipase
MVAALVDYRIDSKHHTTPDMAVSDGLDAMKWVAENATQLGIDTQKIRASGSSAGGHIAACLALCQINQTEMKPMVRPSLLVLFNPVLDLTNATAELEFSPRELELIEAIGPEMARAISPNQHINEHTPDTLMIFGENDPLLQQANDFIPKAKIYDAETQLLIAHNNGHGFFNKEPWKSSSIRAMDLYLSNKGYLLGEPLITADDVKDTPFHLQHNHH